MQVALQIFCEAMYEPCKCRDQPDDFSFIQKIDSIPYKVALAIKGQ